MKRVWNTHSADETREVGIQLGRVLRAGDVVLLHGDLGAGKTTFTQGLAQGLGVQGRVTSPTFIVAREHASRGNGPALVHVDAYRIRDDQDMTTLDLERSQDDAVTVVEWGEGKAEGLSRQRLEVSLTDQGEGSWEDVDAGTRVITFLPHGDRWNDVFDKESS
ncbi:tRNA (adenosine(37)-N6)-threonylcarbamoyltransferase complex ATPase subunit type 1 TsaE [Actinomycetaceae bacterium WB03_NA08]|uniref:tRNA threonylcarbamoyladenosine biosynthesis protein TsaE n=1 Tax=Scrofimicrobium canadense TaxID=2652290 RepID=A0A6N7W6I5_9ACTO|nr:tRNA (adenosine(37)-N6)-threonylcarbamoyltransferase complex ATPase subunit type 1 TsaE [Scrofimicrobium canadense]MSS83768.1 tRNA (adenosine(37)-N6)-threonylcarbamoyltransferase complex ATPase subunit type 1 TsaE [Scrofimicrobium canadense]